MTHVLARLPDHGELDLLFLLFHGVGATADSMAVLAQRLAQEYPQAAVLCVDAPDEFDAAAGRGGRQWFSIQGITDDNRAARVAAALPRFVATVRALQMRFAMAWPRTALFGFSQGAIMALEAAQAEPELAGRVIAFSGRYAALPDHAPRDTCVHLLHGLDDTVVPHGPAVAAARQLVALGADVTADVLPQVGHELDPRLIERAIDQLRTFLPQRTWRAAFEAAPVQSTAASSKDLGR
ncbi:MAG: esterase [Piscinibacter sp.]|uniref:esterase n=1 Tax=Piscinibacter sp. TaxID=1903157 RepID=UPI003D0F886B